MERRGLLAHNLGIADKRGAYTLTNDPAAAGFLTPGGNMFLTQDEIETLTGYVKHKKQREWLYNNGYSFKVACSGRPIVSRTHSESQLSGSASTQPAKWEPNFDALKKVA